MKLMKNTNIVRKLYIIIIYQILAAYFFSTVLFELPAEDRLLEFTLSFFSGALRLANFLVAALAGTVFLSGTTFSSFLAVV